MAKLGDLYIDFSRIDLDTRGGYARVAQVRTHGQEGLPELCAFKLMRHEIDNQKGWERFEDEMKLLVTITNDRNAPSAITRIYDSGFVPLGVSESLYQRESPNPNLEVFETGTDVREFSRTKSDLEKRESDRWLPYLVVELAPYNDSLLRQMHQPHDQSSGLFRLPTGEVITMALHLLDVMNYLHSTMNRAYIDWKPEHIHWDGSGRRVMLIDWNVTTPLEDGPGKLQNVHDDLRLFCGAALYTSLTFIDPDDPSKPIGPRPSTEINSPIPEIRRRYWTNNPDYYQHDEMIDNGIKQIINRGLNPNQGFNSIEELRMTLMEYARQEFGLMESDLTVHSTSRNAYFQALAEIRAAQQKFLNAQQLLIDATEGEKIEFTRLSKVIKRTLMNFPLS
jgi:hypothetical protein